MSTDEIIHMNDSTHLASTPQILVVMPVYNEEASISKVVCEWFNEITKWTDNFIFLVIDDGSTDVTPSILDRLRLQVGPRLEILHQENCGHGQSCLCGYRIACERDIPYVFQVDSDGQCDPQYFFHFWRKRDHFDVVYGHRTRRDDGWRRVAASMILRLTLYLTCGVNCIDANVPYRLMRTSVLINTVDLIPKDFFLANVAMAVLLKINNFCESTVPIVFKERYGGELTVKLRNFGEKAIQLIVQLRALMNNIRIS